MTTGPTLWRVLCVFQCVFSVLQGNFVPLYQASHWLRSPSTDTLLHMAVNTLSNLLACHGDILS